MIFVTVGNALQGFDRLLSAVDALKGQGVFGDEAVLLQTGHARFTPQHCQAEAFVPMERFEELLRTASLLICHGGCTALQAVRAGQYPVVMPRQRRYNEHINDHQVDFTRALDAKGHVAAAIEAADLPQAITRARSGRGVPLPASRVLDLIRQDLETFPR